LSKLVDLDDASFSEFSKALSETMPPLGRDKYVSLLTSKLPRLNGRDLSRLLHTIIALYRVKEKIGLSPIKMASLIKESAEESQEHGSLFQNNRGDTLENRLANLLSFNNTLGLGTKCVLAMLDNDRVCVDAEISTDIRPVFDEAKETFIAGAINHELQITLHGENQSDLHITLDDNDLQELKEEIEKAQKRSVKLKAFLKQSNIFHLE